MKRKPIKAPERKPVSAAQSSTAVSPFVVPIIAQPENAGIMAKLEAMDKKLDRLELVESHLMDILMPHRKAYVRQEAARQSGQLNG